jgi:hypothetical protein
MVARRTSYRNRRVEFTGEWRYRISFFGFLRIDVKVKTDDGEVLWKNCDNSDLPFIDITEKRQ